MTKPVKTTDIVTLPTIIITLVMLELFFRFVIPATDPTMGYSDEENKL